MPLAIGAVLVVAVVVVGGVLVARGGGSSGSVAASTSAAAPTSSAAGGRSSGPRATTSQPAPSSGAGSALPGRVAVPGAQVTYEVTGTAFEVSLVLADEAGAITATDVATLPYTSTFTAGADFLFPTVSATGTGGAVTCRITVDGVVVAEETGAGSLALAVCTAF